MLTLKSVLRNNAVEIILDGNLNVKWEERVKLEFERNIMRKEIQTIGVNFMKVNGIDSSGLRGLIRTSNLCKHEGKKLLLFGVSNDVFAAFKFARLENFFKFTKLKDFDRDYPTQ